MISLLILYLQLRIQDSLPFNPTNMPAVGEHLSFNTAVSFATNTNWQSYGGESTMSHLSQMLGLAVHNFVSAAAGMAVLAAFIRGLARRRASTLGNFWVDLTRTTTRILLPACFVFALILVSQGVIQNFHGFTEVTTVEGGSQVIPGGPVASQIAIKQLGTNGGGFFNTNSAHPFENSTPFNNFLETYAIVIIPFALAFTYGYMVKDRRQGRAVFAIMAAIWLVMSLAAMGFETNGNSRARPVRRGSDGHEPTRPAATWRARRFASAPRPRACGRHPRPARPTGRSTPCTTASRPSAVAFPSRT